MPKGQHSNHPAASKHYRWSRERMIASSGYPKIRVGRTHPLADPNGYAYEHLVVWVAAGRPKPGRGEVLRFANGDRRDCRIENLVLVTRAAHNTEKNKAQLRDPLGRMMSKLATRIVRAGAQVRTVRR
jgi:hypothetical protein